MPPQRKKRKKRTLQTEKSGKSMEITRKKQENIETSKNISETSKQLRRAYEHKSKHMKSPGKALGSH